MINSGSLWHKWDIHMHTPGTERNNEFGGTLQDSDILENFKTKIIENKIDAIGVTDYYSIDNYEYLVELQKNGKFPKNVYLLPNIEIRLETSVRGKSNELVNLHILFDPDKLSPEDIRTNFLSQLSYEYNQHIFKFNESGLESLRSATESDSIKDVKERFSISKKTLLDLLKSNINFEGAYLIAVPNEDISGTLQNNSGKGDFVYDEIANITDIVFSHNLKDYNFWSKNTEIKPVLSGSDAHGFLPKEDTDRYTIGETYSWIKSDLSFNGLKQIKYDPINRTKLSNSSKNNPNDSRSPYIKAIEFEPTTHNFQVSPSKLQINPNLNVIIGPRSSGKSTLATLFAKKASLKFTDENINDSLKKYEFITKNIQTNLITSLANQLDVQVEYYPQNYISNLSEDNTNLQDTISRIISRSEKAKIILDNYQDIINEHNNEIDNITKSLSDNKLYIIAAKKEISALRTQEALNEILNNLSEKKQEIISNSSLTETEISNKNENEIKLAENKTTLSELNDKKYKLSKTFSEIDNFHKQMDPLIETLKVHFSSLRTAENKSAISKNWSEFKSSLSNIKDVEINFLDTEIEKNTVQIETIQSEINEINTKDTAVRKNIEEIDKNLLIVNDDITKLASAKDNLQKYEDAYKKSIEKIINLISKIDSARTTFQDSINKLNILNFGQVEDQSTRLILKDTVDWQDEISNHINRRYSLPEDLDLTMINQSNGSFKWSTDQKALSAQIGTVLNNNDIKFNNNHDNIDLVKVIMKKLTHFTFDLLLGNDSLQEMSPGMKGVVLLQVLLMASNNQSTIILDQPEDDLDNNTIVKMLVPLLKEISNTRQVILVTHNANLVVLTDAEEIIIAERDSSAFSINYSSGSLETSDIRDQITDLLEGGKEAFYKREQRYYMK